MKFNDDGMVIADLDYDDDNGVMAIHVGQEIERKMTSVSQKTHFTFISS
jgi:hypothetical protein